MLDPLAQRLVITQRPPYAEPKITGVGVHKSRCDSAISTMAVNQRQVSLPYLPSLLQNLAKNAVEHDFGWMVAVKVDFHLCPPKLLGPRSNQGLIRKRIAGLSPFVYPLSRDGFNSNLVVHGLSQSLFAPEILFRGLNRGVAQQKLDLFQLTPGAVTETGTRPSKVMGCKFYDSDLACVLLDDVPHHLFGHFRAPSRSRPANATK
jgi:hypothetical protein